MKLRIELISDYICPWCYIGKMRIERVRKKLEGEIDLDIDIKPFILYPHIPPGGAPKSDFTNKTKPGMGRSLKFESKEEGISINYRNIQQIPYSQEAHRLAWLIADCELRYELSKRLFQDYFEKGINIGEEDYLIDTAKSLKVDKNTIGRFLDPSQGYDAYQSYIQDLRNNGITLVPSIRFNPQIVLPSLQPVDVWLNYIRRAAKMQSSISS